MGCLTGATNIELKGEDIMSANKTVYVFTTEEGTTEEFNTIGSLNSFAGIRATKQGILDGKFENIEMVEKSEDEVLKLGDDKVEVDTAPQVPESFVPGANVVVSGDTDDEDLQSYVSEHNDPVLTITEVDTDSGIVHVEGYMHGIDYTDLILSEEQEPTQEALDLAEVIDNSDKVEVIVVGDAPKAPVKEEPKAKKEDKPKAKVLTNKEEDTTDVDMDFPEVGDFEDDKEMGKYIKELTNEQLAEWIDVEGIEHNVNDNPSINRMRMAMAIKQLHFPKAQSTGTKAKKKSKYGHLSMEDLAGMVIDNDITVRNAKGDARIERMYMIMALKDAGVDLEDKGE